MCKMRVGDLVERTYTMGTSWHHPQSDLIDFRIRAKVGLAVPCDGRADQMKASELAR